MELFKIMRFSFNYNTCLPFIYCSLSNLVYEKITALYYKTTVNYKESLVYPHSPLDLGGIGDIQISLGDYEGHVHSKYYTGIGDTTTTQRSTNEYCARRSQISYGFVE